MILGNPRNAHTHIERMEHHMNTTPMESAISMVCHRIDTLEAAEANALELEARTPYSSEDNIEAGRLAHECQVALAEARAILDGLLEL